MSALFRGFSYSRKLLTFLSILFFGALILFAPLPPLADAAWITISWEAGDSDDGNVTRLVGGHNVILTSSTLRSSGLAGAIDFGAPTPPRTDAVQTIRHSGILDEQASVWWSNPASLAGPVYSGIVLVNPRLLLATLHEPYVAGELLDFDDDIRVGFEAHWSTLRVGATSNSFVSSNALFNDVSDLRAADQVALIPLAATAAHEVKLVAPQNTLAVAGVGVY